MSHSQVTLTSFDDIPTFIDDLFEPSVRNASDIVDHIKAGNLHISFVDDDSKGSILNAWLAAWQYSQGDSYSSSDFGNCPSWDRSILSWLAGYIKTNNLNLCLPQLTYQGMKSGTTQAVYKNAGYTSSPFLTSGKYNYGTVTSDGHISGSQPTVATFLKSLYYGAHCVAVSAPGDVGDSSVQNLYNVLDGSTLITRHDSANSHYAYPLIVNGTQIWGNLTGFYYQSVTSQAAPGNDGLILSLLFGYTSDAIPNTFLQLEGWQNQWPSDNDWHQSDFDTHEATLWNFSTYGACAYSEKRSSPVFLAPSSFSLALDSKTKMPLYEGAGSVQAWMRTDLMEI